MIRIGKRIYNRDGTFTDPTYKDYIPIPCVSASTSYGSLSPFVLKDKHDHILENVWQFSKVYPTVPASTQRYSRYDFTVIWSHPKEKHYIRGVLTDEFWDWRQKGFDCKYAIRYPVGYNHRHECLFAVSLKSTSDEVKKLSYIEARKEIYLPIYEKAVKKEKLFKKLLTMHEDGDNLLIIDVDGPHQESLKYYQNQYDVNDNFIINNTVKCNEKNMKILLNDEKHPFGHGYCLGMTLKKS